MKPAIILEDWLDAVAQYTWPVKRATVIELGSVEVIHLLMILERLLEIYLRFWSGLKSYAYRKILALAPRDFHTSLVTRYKHDPYIRIRHIIR